mmetsp:Transcript_25464/g.76401  ORF Transcript_25464/g.76401 Transcript_25464/m.76401 type:complete len:148 (+) Transcript_25464:821-1264(+)
MPRLCIRPWICIAWHIVVLPTPAGPMVTMPYGIAAVRGALQWLARRTGRVCCWVNRLSQTTGEALSRREGQECCSALHHLPPRQRTQGPQSRRSQDEREPRLSHMAVGRRKRPARRDRDAVDATRCLQIAPVAAVLFFIAIVWVLDL